VPDCVVDLVRSFHDGMVATMAVSEEEASPFEVRNSLHQGCTIVSSPTYLFCILNKLVMLLQWSCFAR